MKTKATVIAVEQDRATVESERVSACEGCHKVTEEGGCSVCSLMGPNRKIRTEAYNFIGANVGDTVMIESATGRMLGYAVLVFLVPLVITALFACVAACFTASVAWQIACGGVGFVASFVGIFFYSRAVQKKRCDVEITEILKTE